MNKLQYFINVLGFTENEVFVIIVLSKVASAFSILGSIYVIQDVLRDPRKRGDSIYHRVMLGVSISDFILALTYFLGTWPMPKGSQMFAVGNKYICQLLGMVWTVGLLSSPLYNCSLATYYLLELKFCWVRRRMKAIEKWFHIIPWTVAGTPAVIALFLRNLKPSLLVCGISPGNLFFHIYYVAFYCASIVYVISAMFLVFKYVRGIEVRAATYSFASYTNSRSQADERRRSRRVMVQGIMYAIALILVFVPVMVLIYDRSAASYMQGYFLMTLQGCYNAFIYSNILQKWLYNNDGNCRCLCNSLSTAARMRASLTDFVCTMRNSDNSATTRRRSVAFDLTNLDDLDGNNGELKIGCAVDQNISAAAAAGDDEESQIGGDVVQDAAAAAAAADDDEESKRDEEEGVLHLQPSISNDASISSINTDTSVRMKDDEEIRLLQESAK